MKTPEEVLKEVFDKNPAIDIPTPIQGLIIVEAINTFANQSPWIPVSERPLYKNDNNGNWICTEDGDSDFIAAVPYVNKNFPGKSLWWIRHCVIEDEIGLCVVGDVANEPAGWSLEDVTHWQPFTRTP